MPRTSQSLQRQRLRSGTLKHRVTIKTITTTRSATGGEVTVESSQTVWGSVEPMMGREQFELHTQKAEQTYRVRFRHVTGIDATDTLEFTDRENRTHVLNIKSIANPEEAGRHLEVLAVEA